MLVTWVIVNGIYPNHGTNALGIGHEPKVGWKITRMKCSGSSLSCKWPILAGLPWGLLLDPSSVTSAGAPRSIIAYTKNKSLSYMVQIHWYGPSNLKDCALCVLVQWDQYYEYE
jgi:hypothetical protein